MRIRKVSFQWQNHVLYRIVPLVLTINMNLNVNMLPYVVLLSNLKSQIHAMKDMIFRLYAAEYLAKN